MLLFRKREFPEKMSAALSKVPKAARMKERTFFRREGSFLEFFGSRRGSIAFP